MEKHVDEFDDTMPSQARELEVFSKELHIHNLNYKVTNQNKTDKMI